MRLISYVSPSGARQAMGTAPRAQEVGAVGAAYVRAEASLGGERRCRPDGVQDDAAGSRPRGGEGRHPHEQGGAEEVAAGEGRRKSRQVARSVRSEKRPF